MRKTNSGGAGTLTDLGSFLFGCERAALTAYRDVLIDWSRRADAAGLSSLGAGERIAWEGYSEFQELRAKQNVE